MVAPALGVVAVDFGDVAEFAFGEATLKRNENIIFRDIEESCQYQLCLMSEKAASLQNVSNFRVIRT